MLKLKHLLGGFLAILALIFIVGCGTSRAYYKDQYITSQVDPYVYSMDFHYVWQTARSMLFKYGYRVIPGPDPVTIETDWAMIDEDTYRRYLVSGHDFGDGRCTVHFDYYEETRNPGYSPYVTSGRDYKMEYDLIRAVESQRWNEIESGSERYADERIAADEAKKK